MAIDKIQTKHFSHRLKVADHYSLALVSLLEKKGYIDSFEKATKEEDLGGIDFWIKEKDSKKSIPIQLKLRDRQRDLPICRFQPFYGTDSPRTVVGRDYRSIIDQKSVYYYVGVCSNQSISEVYRMSCSFLKETLENVDQCWRDVEEGSLNTFGLKFFDSNKTQQWIKSIWNKRVYQHENGVEIWWKKNPNEAFSKFNVYVPEYYRDWGFKLSLEDKEEIKAL